MDIDSYSVFWDDRQRVGIFSAAGLPIVAAGRSESLSVQLGFIRMDVHGVDDTCAWIEAFVVENEPWPWTVTAEQMTGVWDPDGYYCGY